MEEVVEGTSEMWCSTPEEAGENRWTTAAAAE